MSARVDHRGLRRYLLPGETPAAEIRHHAIVLLKPALVLLLATLLALWLDLSVSEARSGILPYVWFAWLIALGWSAWQWIEWRNTRIVATDKRIVLFEGWLNHKVSMMPLKKVTDMGYERSILGRILGYGTFVLESAGQDQALSQISFVPDPDENYRAICAVVFGLPTTDEEDSAAWETSAEEDLVTDEDYAPETDDDWVRTGHRRGAIYRSRDLLRSTRDDDTGELPPYDPNAY